MQIIDDELKKHSNNPVGSKSRNNVINYSMMH